MTAVADTTPREPAEPGELRALFTRLRKPEDRPVMTEEESESWRSLDQGYEFDIRSHLDQYLGESGPMARDIGDVSPIDVATVEPQGGTRPWGALFTIGAGALAVPGDDAPGAPPPVRRFELVVRLPMSAFKYVYEMILEPFDDFRDAVTDALGELARLPHLRGVCYAPPQIVATPDLSPLAEGLPFAGVLLRDASETCLGRIDRTPCGPPPREVPGFGVVTFLTVTFLHASEVRALLGKDRKAALARLDRARVDEMVDLRRMAVM